MRGTLLVERDIERAWLALDSEAGPMDDLLGHAITYRIAVGPRAGQKLFMLQTPPARQPQKDGVARTGGFTLHAGVCVLEPLDLMARLAALVPPPRTT